MSKIFLYDFETTGLYAKENAVHQMNAMIIVDNEVKEEFDFKIRPHEKAVINEEALKVGNVSKEQIMAYPPHYEVYTNLISKLSRYVNRFDKKDKFHLLGFNNRKFDDDFFREFFSHNNDKYFGSWFWPDSIDAMVLASNKLQDVRPTMENFKLRTVAKTLGIEVDDSKLHDAKYDRLLTYEIYKKVK